MFHILILVDPALSWGQPMVMNPLLHKCDASATGCKLAPISLAVHLSQ
jgi:hypothetical protein